MPVIKCRDHQGNPGYKIQGTNGCAFTYEQGNEAARKRAKRGAYKHYGRLYKKSIAALEVDELIDTFLPEGDAEPTVVVEQEEYHHEESVATDIAEYYAADAKVDPKSTKVQSLIFSKDKFKTAAECSKWAKDHNFKSSPVAETSNSFRIRQKSPGKFSKIRTIQISDGIAATVGIP